VKIYVCSVYLKYSSYFSSSSSSSSSSSILNSPASSSANESDDKNDNGSGDHLIPEKKRQRETIHLQLQAVAGIIAIVSLSFLFVPELAAMQFIGIVGMGTTMLMFLGPLSTMSSVIKLKNSSSINYPLALATCLNCVLWMLYSRLILKDNLVFIPNLLGLICGLLQVSLKIRYPDTRGKGRILTLFRRLSKALPTTTYKKEDGSNR
jgi:uncharacterized protein with PQ loop repeat